jgi:ABC-type transport system involved in multi-copper enzyme maturation permease subunit
MLTGAVHPVGLFLVILGWFVYAGWVAILGLLYSATCRTTLRAMVWTLVTVLFAYGGHLLTWTCCCFPLLMASSGPGFSGEGLQHLAYFQVFALSPPASLGTFAFRLGDLERSWGREEEEFFLFAILGLAIWGAFTILLWSVTYGRLQQVTLRARLRPERMRPPRPRTPIRGRQVEEIPTVEEVPDDEP